MVHRYLVKAAAWLEVIVGLALIAAPDLPSRLLLGAGLDGAGVPVARFAGIALLALGCTCLFTAAAAPRGALWGLYIFNAAASILLAWVGLATPWHGVLLWPAVILHAAIAAGLVPGLRKTR